MITTLPELGRRRRAEVDEFSRLSSEELFREIDADLWKLVAGGLATYDASDEVNAWRDRNTRNLWRGVRQVMAARMLDIPTMYGSLWIKVIRENGDIEDYGLASLRVVTTAGCNFMVQNFIGAQTIANFKYHGVGTGTNAEASSDTALQTELTTQYNPASTRATGTQGTGGSSNIYATTGTNTVQTASAITEHGILTQAATGGGTLLDRSVFSVINLNIGDSIQTPYAFTATAGG